MLMYRKVIRIKVIIIVFVQISIRGQSVSPSQVREADPEAEVEELFRVFDTEGSGAVGGHDEYGYDATHRSYFRLRLNNFCPLTVKIVSFT